MKIQITNYVFYLYLIYPSTSKYTNIISNTIQKKRKQRKNKISFRNRIIVNSKQDRRHLKSQMDNIKMNPNSNETCEEMTKEKKKQIDEFISFEYFYNSLNKLDSDGALVFSKIIECLNKDVIKLKELTQFIQSKRCIPDQARGVIWRILLNYLPENRKHWITILENNAKHYQQLVDEYIVSKNKKNKAEQQQQQYKVDEESIAKQPSSNNNNNNNNNNQKNIDQQEKPQIIKEQMKKNNNLFDNAPAITLQLKNPLMKSGGSSLKNLEIKENCADHPLNRKQTSSWNSHFKDLEIWELIEKDTKRTRAEFYLLKNDQIKLYNGQVAKLFRKQIVTQKQHKQHELQKHGNQLQKDGKELLKSTNIITSLPKDLASNVGDKTESVKQSVEQNKEQITHNNKQTAELEEYRYDVITRILFLYYKITPEDAKVKYVQGMNEIIGLIYQCFSQETSQYLREKAESDAFYCFCIVMTKIKAMFNFQKTEQTISSLKNSSTQLDSYKIYIDAFIELFKKVDIQLFNYLAQLNIDPKLYCLNWMIGFFCQNFDAQRAMQVWDCLFISNDIIEFIPYICVSIMYINRDELIEKQSSEIILKLQNISGINLDKLMKMAFNLYNQFS